MIPAGIIAGRVARFFVSPLGVAAIGLAVSAGAYKVGNMIGFSAGEAAQVVKQAEADAEAADRIKERVKDALEEIGADADPDSVDRILRGLAGVD